MHTTFSSPWYTFLSLWNDSGWIGMFAPVITFSLPTRNLGSLVPGVFATLGYHRTRVIIQYLWWQWCTCVMYPRHISTVLTPLQTFRLRIWRPFYRQVRVANFHCLHLTSNTFLYKVSPHLSAHWLSISETRSDTPFHKAYLAHTFSP